MRKEAKEYVRSTLRFLDYLALAPKASSFALRKLFCLILFTLKAMEMMMIMKNKTAH